MSCGPVGRYIYQKKTRIDYRNHSCVYFRGNNIKQQHPTSQILVLTKKTSTSLNGFDAGNMKFMRNG